MHDRGQGVRFHLNLNASLCKRVQIQFEKQIDQNQGT